MLRSCRPAILVISVFLSLAAGSRASVARDDSEYRGRPLVEVLERLRARGLNLVFTTAVVREDVVVTVEPTATEPRAILEEILAPLRLRARSGPAGSILILPAEPTVGRLRGRVVSATRGLPVVGATVGVAGGTLSTTTRPDGTFVLLGVPAGTHNVLVEAPGFYPATIPGTRVPPAPAVDLTIPLTAQPTLVAEIVVTPGTLSIVERDPASGLSVTDDDAVFVPTFGGDVSRVIELLPGVAAPDNSAAFHVRGSSARDVSLVLDGLELYEPFHLLQFQSPFSLIDSQIVDRIDFFGGGPTADFGDRHGGVVKVSTLTPVGAPHTRAELGTLNARVAHGAPMSRASGSWLVSARAWYPEALRDTIELGEKGLDPRFADAYVKASWSLSPKTVVSAHGLISADRFEFAETDGNERVFSSNRSGHFWVRIIRAWSPGLVSETLLSAGRIERVRRGISEPEEERITVEDDRTVDFQGVKNDVSWEPSSSHLFKAGLEIRRLTAGYRYASGTTADPASSTTIRLDPDGTSLGAYLAFRAALSLEFTVEAGVRFDRQSATGDDSWDPRLHAVWRAGERSELRFGLGSFSQSQRIHELSVEDGETSFHRAELSRQSEVTLQHRWRHGIRFRLDAYSRKQTRLQPRFENLFSQLELFPETESDRVLVSPARARIRGTEILLRGDPDRPLNWSASYAWSSADDVIDGAGVPRSWDQTHAARLLAGYRPNERWLVSLTASAHTGWPTTPVSAEAVPQPDGSTTFEIVPGARNSARLPGYVRFDGKASRSFALPRGRLRMNVEILNLANRKNVCCIDGFLLDPRPDGSVAIRPELNFWLGITPTFSVLWEF